MGAKKKECFNNNYVRMTELWVLPQACRVKEVGEESTMCVCLMCVCIHASTCDCLRMFFLNDRSLFLQVRERKDVHGGRGGCFGGG